MLSQLSDWQFETLRETERRFKKIQRVTKSMDWNAIKKSKEIADKHQEFLDALPRCLR